MPVAPSLRSVRVALRALSLASLIGGGVIGQAPSHAVSLDQACATYAERLNAAVASGDTQKARTVYEQGRQRIASRFGGATCPDVKAPAGS